MREAVFAIIAAGQSHLFCITLHHHMFTYSRARLGYIAEVHIGRQFCKWLKTISDSHNRAVDVQTLKLLAATALVGMVLLAFAGHHEHVKASKHTIHFFSRRDLAGMDTHQQHIVVHALTGFAHTALAKPLMSCLIRLFCRAFAFGSSPPSSTALQ